MNLLCVKKIQAFLKRAALLLAGALVVSCEQPPGSIPPPVNALPPNITGQPADGAWDVSADQTFDLTVTASGTDSGTLSYQWYSNSTNAAVGGTAIGTNSATLSLAKADYTANEVHYFYVAVTNTINDNGDGGNKTAAITSNAAAVTVTGNGGPPGSVNAGQPGISVQPVGGIWDVAAADTFTLVVTAASPDNGTLSCQWYWNSTDSAVGGTPMNGKTEAALILAKADYGTNGDYYFYAVVTNAISDNGDGGTKTAAKASDTAMVTVTGNGGAYSVNAEQPGISVQPVGGAWDVSAADNFSLTVTAGVTDGGTLSYRWYSNSTNAAAGGTATGTNSAVLSLAKADYTANGTCYFYVIVTNTISDNGDGGTKTAVKTSDTVMVTVTGNIVPDGIQIFSQSDMAKIGVENTHPLSGTYVLMNDITLENWKPVIGGNNEDPFSGVFNGNNRTITLKSFDNTFVGSYAYNNGVKYTNVFLGIFGAVRGASASAKAEIKNLRINSSVNIASANQTADSGVGVGLVAGYAEMAVIDTITLSGSFGYKYGGNNGSAYLGGIAGFIIGKGTVIKNCTSSMVMDIKPGYGKAQIVPGNAASFSFVGGFVGFFKDGGGIEHCHNSGAVSAISDINASQVMIGGILGGSHYSFSDDPHGYIADCSSAGDITVSCKGFWPMAGGIAGVMAGGSAALENSTRIVRCFAGGQILNASAGGSGQWPYLGGIVGYIYVGAKVSQCYFDGKVINEKTNDYTGGIAGYSSYATGYNDIKNNPCLIEDCWSSGEVKGYNNAGGIVGQNQQNTLLKRSYSLMDISVINGGTSTLAQWGIGGIAGSHSSTRLADAMESCVALNAGIYAPKGSEIHRIGGGMREAGGVFPIMTNVYALPDLLPVTGDSSYAADKGTNRPDGADIPGEYLSGGKPAKEFYESIGWDFTNVWKMGSDGYPKLKWQ